MERTVTTARRRLTTPISQRDALHRLKLHLLTELDLFAGLNGLDIDRVVERTTMVSMPKGRVLTPDETEERLFILKQGRVQLYRLSPTGKKFILEVLQPGSVFGQCVLTGQRLSETFVEFVADSVVCVLHRGEVERLIEVAPRVGIRLLEILGRRVYELEERLEELAFKRVPARLAALLLRLVEQEGNPVRGYSHQDLADMIGTYRETVTQMLADLKQQGILEVGRKHICILDVDALREIAESHT